MSNDKQDKNRISYEINKEMEGGAYINHAFILHSKKEFILDFGLGLPSGNVKVQSRIITNPLDAKAIMLALQENIRNYERKFGEIPVPPPSESPDESKLH
ncbi:MAG: DUF3467 domain-containing protein [bacterium]